MKRILAAAILALAPQAATAGPIGAFTDLVIFGDSLSDVGRAFVATDGAVPPTPPYFEGQFTGPDGPVWAETFGDAVVAGGGTVLNLAFGGAEALGDTIVDLGGQLGQYQSLVDDNLANPGSDTLAAFWFGANDIFADPTAETGEEAADAVIDAAKALAVQGVGNFLFFTYPNLGSTPLLASTGLAAAGATATAAYNNRLRANIGTPGTDGTLEALGVDVTVIDTGPLFAAVQANPGEFGFTNVTVPCVVTDGNGGVVSDCSAVTGVDASTFLWFDRVHPNSRAHALVADQAIAAFTPVPLPAGVWLMIAALAALAAPAARRKAAA
jgi:phospholipase/lecithinase/hemolysin